jgi:shikimate kinase
MTAACQNIVLAGFMGTGKTTIGRRLADRLNLRFVDMDVVIESREGCAISDIFRLKGEPHFRELEAKLARELAAQTGQVIATGGGVVLNPANISAFSQTGLVVCLRATPETILARVGRAVHRPLLETPDKEARIRALLASRQPFYDALPVQVETDGRSPESIVGEIVALYQWQNDILKRTDGQDRPDSTS